MSVGEGNGTSVTRTTPVSRGVSPPFRCFDFESVISLRGERPLLIDELVDEDCDSEDEV